DPTPAAAGRAAARRGPGTSNAAAAWPAPWRPGPGPGPAAPGPGPARRRDGSACVASLAVSGCERELQGLVVLHVMRRRRFAGRQRTLREGLEVGDAGVAPPLRFLLLDAEEHRDLVVAFRIDLALEAGPGAAHAAHVVHATAVTHDQLVPQAAAGGHAVVPGHVVEPQQECLRHGIDAAELLRHRRRVRGHGVAAGGAAVEADAARVGTVVVDRGPVRARATFDPRAGTVMVATPHQVVQAQRGHVVDH